MILCLLFLFYIPALFCDFIIDDLAVFAQTESNNVPRPKNFFVRFKEQFLGRNYWKEKGSSIEAHAMTIAIHFVVCWLIYLVFGMTPIAYLAALLFAVNPTNHEVSIWLSGKSYGMTAIASLICWWIPFLAPAIIFVPPWMFTVNGLFFPVMFAIRGGWWPLMALITVIALYNNRWIFDKDKNEKIKGYRQNPLVQKIYPKKIIIALKFYGYYLANASLALHTAFYQAYMYDWCDSEKGIKNGTKLDRYFFIGVVAALGTFAGFIFARNSMITFGMVWASVNFAMWSNFVNTGQQYTSSRQYYLANIGLCLALAGVLIQFPWAGGALIGWYCYKLVHTIRHYQNEYWHLEYQIIDEPHFGYSWLMHGNINFVRGHFTAAIADYTQALDLMPKDFKTLFNLSSAWLARGELKKSVLAFEEARKSDCYGQWDRKDEVCAERMQLLNKCIYHKMNLELKISDIKIVA